MAKRPRGRERSEAAGVRPGGPGRRGTARGPGGTGPLRGWGGKNLIKGGVCALFGS